MQTPEGVTMSVTTVQIARSALPRVTVAIPLYRSKVFQQTILDNLERLTYPNLEILISDRHGADDTLDVLAQRYAGDAQFRFFKSRDQLDWVEHFNLLIEAATGKYMMWMPHDDVFPSDYVPLLVECLENSPDAILAFGRMDAIDWEGQRIRDRLADWRTVAGAEWSPRVALRLFVFSYLGRPFRGLFRREVIRHAGLAIRPTYENVQADQDWVFAVGLVGRLAFVPACRCAKRYYPWSTHARWRMTARHIVNHFWVLRSYIRDLVPEPGLGAYLTAGIFLWMCQQLAVRSSYALPPPWRNPVRTVYRKLIRPPLA